MAGVTYEHVYKRYPGNVVITDMSAEIKDKEFVVLVGPSGSGKSTALRMLAGLEEISDGTVRIGDRVVNDVAPKDRDIAMVFQSYALYPRLTVHDNLSFVLTLRQTPKAVPLGFILPLARLRQFRGEERLHRRQLFGMIVHLQTIARRSQSFRCVQSLCCYVTGPTTGGK